MTACYDYTEFKGVTHYGNDQLMVMLEANLKSWLDWSLLRIGGWTDVSIPQTGVHGGDFAELRLVDDPSYASGQVWEGVRKDWVWETGVNYTDVNGTGHDPQPVGTPVVDGSPTAASYHVNYPLGRIIFDSPISTTSTVELDYAYRDCQVVRADSAPWFRQLQFRSFRPDDLQVSQTTRGEWSIGGQHRIQMPTILLESVPRGTSKGYELGNDSLVIMQDVLFHVMAESRTLRNNLVDMIRQQSDKAIWLFDTNRVVAGGDYPLDYRGELVGSKMYPDLVDTIANGGYRWNKCYFMNATVSEIEALHPTLYEGMVRTTMEIVLGGM